MALNFCRVCLVDNDNIIVTNIDYYQDIYEKVTNVKFKQYSWPAKICYICLKLLQKCYKFIQAAQNVNDFLTQFNYCQEKMKLYKNYRKKLSLHRFSVLNLENINIYPKQNLDADHNSDTKIFTNSLDYKFNIAYSSFESHKDIKKSQDSGFVIEQAEVDPIASEDVDLKNKIKTEIETMGRPKRKCIIYDHTATKKKKLNNVKIEIADDSDFFNETNLKHNKLNKSMVSKGATKNKKEDNNNRQCNKNTISCDICKFKCVKRIELVKHLKYHNENRKLVCDLCGYRFHKLHLLKQHKYSEHNEENNEKELNNFKIDSNNIYYEKKNSETMYSCLKCEFKTLEKKELTMHTKIHGKEKPKPFLCHYCDFKCTEKRGLSYHIRTHTGEKPFSCSLCDYKCSTKGSLDRHQKVHTKVKPFLCNMCQYKAAESDSLKKHLRIHTGEKPFACHICEFRCKVKSNLNVHLKFHTGEKPFACSKCEYKCTQSSALKMHVARMHNRDKSNCETKSNY